MSQPRTIEEVEQELRRVQEHLTHLQTAVPRTRLEIFELVWNQVRDFSTSSFNNIFSGMRYNLLSFTIGIVKRGRHVDIHVIPNFRKNVGNSNNLRYKTKDTRVCQINPLIKKSSKASIFRILEKKMLNRAITKRPQAFAPCRVVEANRVSHNISRQAKNIGHPTVKRFLPFTVVIL